MEKEKMIETVMAFSPTERQIDFYGCEIGVSRQWYNEATAILTEINEGKYLKVPDGAVVLTKEEYEKFRMYEKQVYYMKNIYSDKLVPTAEGIANEVEQVRKETAREIFNKLLNLCYDDNHPRGSIAAGEIRYIAKMEYGFEVEA